MKEMVGSRPRCQMSIRQSSGEGVLGVFVRVINEVTAGS